MLPENTGPKRKKSALERRIAMGLNEHAEPAVEKGVDVEQFIAEEPTGDSESDDEE